MSYIYLYLCITYARIKSILSRTINMQNNSTTRREIYNDYMGKQLYGKHLLQSISEVLVFAFAAYIK